MTPRTLATVFRLEYLEQEDRDLGAYRIERTTNVVGVTRDGCTWRLVVLLEQTGDPRRRYVVTPIRWDFWGSAPMFAGGP